MLIRFLVENFLSFKEPIEFNLTASKERIHPHHVRKFPKKNEPKILRLAAIYGANASGKSNLVNALKFIKELVVEESNINEIIEIRRFRLDSECTTKPSRFEIDFRANDNNYRYIVILNQKDILNEYLYVIDNNKEEILFERKLIDNKSNIKLGKKIDKALSLEDKEFMKFIIRGTRNNQLFLTETVVRNHDIFRDIYNWFDETLHIIQPESKYIPLELRISDDDDFKVFFDKILQESGTGISSIISENTNMDDFKNHPLYSRFSKKINQISQSGILMIGDRNITFAIQRIGDEIQVKKLSTIHKQGDKEFKFEISEESDGTKRLFDFIPLLYETLINNSENVYIIDEIERSLHPHLTKFIVNSHLDPSNSNKSSQMIVATHETYLMDTDLLRRDELWFIEKKKDGSSEIYSLSDFNKRYDKIILKDYLMGRYGAIPYISSSNFILSLSDISNSI